MLISEKTIEAAFDWLKTSAGPAASAKARRIRAEYETKRVRSRLFLESEEGSVAAKEAWAMCHPDFEKAIEAEVAAVEEDEFFRNQRDKASAVTEAWRTEQASIRALEKFR